MSKTNSKLYLSVPFAQKDEAKALGAKWDAALKQWFVPHGLDAAPFERWHSAEQPMPSVSPQRATRAGNAKAGGVVIAVTRPLDQDFVAYASDAPPWE